MTVGGGVASGGFVILTSDGGLAFFVVSTFFATSTFFVISTAGRNLVLGGCRSLPAFAMTG